MLLGHAKFVMHVEQPSESIHMEIKERWGLKMSNQEMEF